MPRLTPPNTLAERLGVSLAAVELSRAADFIDLHLDAHIPIRLFGQDVRVRGGPRWLRGHRFGHFDVPRALDGGLSGAQWSITTNPFRGRKGRWKTFLSNLESLKDIVAASSGSMQICRSYSEYQRAKAREAFAVIPCVQGANCLDGALRGPLDVPDQLLVRATLMHLTNSRLGVTSSPWGRLRKDRGLTARGRALVAQMNEARVFVDLAHAHPDSFWDALDVHDKQTPVLVTHTGVQSVYPSWRNIDDDQLRAVADFGGVVGIIYASFYLMSRWVRPTVDHVLQHVEHAIHVCGEEHVGIGTDHDGFIVPPPPLRSADAHPRLVQGMLDRGWSQRRIERVLGQNFLRVFQQLRP